MKVLSQNKLLSVLLITSLTVQASPDAADKASKSISKATVAASGAKSAASKSASGAADYVAGAAGSVAGAASSAVSQAGANAYAAGANVYAAGNNAAQKVMKTGAQWQNSAFNAWEDSQLKSLLANMKEKVEQTGTDTHDALVNRANQIFALWSTSDLRKWLADQGQNVEEVNSKVADKAESAAKAEENERERLYKQAMDYLSTANKKSQKEYDSIVKSVTDGWTRSQKSPFQSWSQEDLKYWLKSKGVDTPSTYTHEQYVAAARKHWADLKANTAQFGDSVKQNANAGAKYASQTARDYFAWFKNLIGRGTNIGVGDSLEGNTDL